MDQKVWRIEPDMKIGPKPGQNFAKMDHLVWIFDICDGQNYFWAGNWGEFQWCRTGFFKIFKNISMALSRILASFLKNQLNVKILRFLSRSGATQVQLLGCYLSELRLFPLVSYWSTSECTTWLRVKLNEFLTNGHENFSAFLRPQ